MMEVAERTDAVATLETDDSFVRVSALRLRPAHLM